MNANKQDAGGLPERTIRALYLAVGLNPDKPNPDALLAKVCSLRELCRAAPAGGECQHEWQPDADVMNARYCPKCDVTQTIPKKLTHPQDASGDAESTALYVAMLDVQDMATEALAHWDADRDSKVGKMLLAMSGRLPGYDSRADKFHAAMQAKEAK